MVEETRSVARRFQDLVPMGDGQRGQSLIIVAFLIIALLAVVGLAVDLGLMYVEKVRLGRAVDAAALAGAQELPDEGAAYDRMVEYLNLNGYDENAEGFDLGWAFPDEFDCTNPPCAHYHLVVSGTQSVNLTFLRVLRFETVDVSADAIGENANRLDVAIVLDVSGSMDDDTCRPPELSELSHGCSPWWGSSTDIFYEDFSTYTVGDGPDADRLCASSSPWSCYYDEYVGARIERPMSGGGNYGQTESRSGEDGSFYRYIDASPYSQIEIALYERTYSCGSTSVRIRGWPAPGGGWVAPFMDLSCSDTWRQRVYGPDTYGASSFGLKFGIYSGYTADFGYFDNIRVRGVTSGIGPYIPVLCTNGTQNCVCDTKTSSSPLQCTFDDLAGRYKAQPLWDTLDAADWFITECKLGPGEDDPPCLDPDLDQIGLAYYHDDNDSTNKYPNSADSTTASELSFDYAVITNTLWTEFSASLSTNIGDGIYRGCEILSTNQAEGHFGRTNAVHVMILLSDGIPNRPCNPLIEDCSNAYIANPSALDHIDKAVNWAVQNGIIIFTISLGSQADQALMTEIAETTGGIHQYAETTDDLQAVFQQIAQHIFLRLTG
ncbi:MAG TPA: vWA domain-containing protein [Anaerolineae bacterium]|nr:vWA domain-containing protein [Anaerolineae bacterium]